MNRRQIVIGCGSTCALIGSGAAWRVTRAPQTASLPWQFDPTPLADRRLDAFRYAILAPNPHNRQPWLIRLEGDDSAVISCNLSRRLEHTDPFDRQITIGFGTFIELARIAAAERSVRVEIDPFPEGLPEQRLDTRPVARLRFTRDASTARDPLFAWIRRRHTNRDAYEMARRVPDTVAADVAGTDGWTTDQARLAGIRTIAVEAITTEFRTPRANQETVDLMRIGHVAIDANPDGIALSGAMIEALDATGLISKAALADPTSSVFDSGLQQVRSTHDSIPALFWVKTPGNSRNDQLEAGRRYVRAHLRAVAAGLNVHPMSQSLQEYPELADAFTGIHQLLGARGTDRIQMLARMGYGSRSQASPRWPMETHINP